MKTLYIIISVLTAMIGYTIHHSLFWSIMDFLFTPITWIKWILFHEITLTVFKETFSWFFQ
jgi:hypothetical protein